MTISAYLGVAGLLDVGYRFYTSTEAAVAVRVTAGITDSGDGWYSASVTLPATSASVRWDSTGTTDAKAREYWPDPWGHPVADGYPSGTAGYVLGTNLDTTISSRATPAQVQTELTTYGALKPTTAGRTLDVSVTGEAGMDWANVGSPATAQNLSATTISASQVVASVTNPVALTAAYDAAKTAASQTSVNTIDDFVDTEVSAIKVVTDKLDTALELDGAVYRYTTNALEQAPTGGSAPTAAVIADAVWDEAIAGHLTAGSTGNALNAAGSSGDPWSTSLPGAYGAGTAGKILGDNLDAKISSRSVYAGTDTAGTVAIQTVTDKLSTMVEADGAVYRYTVNALENSPSGGGASAAVIADAVWDEALSGHLTAGSAGAALNGAGSAGDPWTTPLPGAYGAGTAGKIIGDNLNATVSSRATQTSVDTIGTNVTGIKSKTDALPTDPADASVIAASFASVDTKLNTIDDFLDTEIGNIQTKVNALPADPADASDIATSFVTVNGKLDAINGSVDTEVGAIKLVTDKLNTALEVDGPVWRYTVNALEQAPTGGGGSDPWAVLVPGSYGAGTAGKILGDNLDAKVSTRMPTSSYVAPDNTGIVAIKAKTDQLNFSGTDVKATLDGENVVISPADLTAIADAILKRDWTAISGEAAYSLLNAVRFLRNVWNTTETPGFLTVKKENGSTTAWTRPLATDPTAAPIVGVS